MLKCNSHTIANQEVTRHAFRSAIRNVTCKVSIALFGLIGCVTPLHAGYVWTPDSSGAYAGTNAPWVADANVQGKWVTSGTNSFTGETNVAGNGSDQYLTIDGATVTFEGASRVGQDAPAGYLTIQNGGTLNLESTIAISDTSGVSTGYVKVDGGTLNSKLEVRLGFHWNGYLDVVNGGKVTAGTLSVGGPDARKGRGNLTIGALDTETVTGNTGTVSVGNLNVSGNGPSTITVNNGSLSVTGNMTLGTASTTPMECELITNVNAQGTLTVGGTLDFANLSQTTAIMNVNGGSVTAKNMIIGNNAGKGTLNIEDGTGVANVKVTETLNIGNKGTGNLNLKSGTLTAETLNVGANGKYTATGGTTNISTLNTNAQGNFTVTGGTLKISNLNGIVYIGDANAETAGNVTLDSTLNIGNGTLSIQNASALIQREINLNTSGGKNSVLDIGKGATVTAQRKSDDTKMYVLRMGQHSGTLNIHDGGQFIIKDGMRFLAGDVAGTMSNISIIGKGSRIEFINAGDDKQFAFGYHGDASTVVGDGGTISGNFVTFGYDGAGTSTLDIYGSGSLVEATNTLTLGSNTKTITNLIVTENGVGMIDAKTIRMNTGKGSTLNVGIDNGVVMIRNYTAAGYDVLDTESDISFDSTSIWKTTKNDTITTITLNEEKLAGLLRTDGAITVSESLRSLGWANAEIGNETKIELNLEGLTEIENTVLLADWLMEGYDDSFTAIVSDVDTITLFDVESGNGIFAWDFNSFNELNGLNVGLSSVKAYVPEPSTWALLILGGFGLLVARRRKG